MNKNVWMTKSVYRLPVKIIERLGKQVVELKTEDTSFTKSSLLELCVLDLLKDKIEPKNKSVFTANFQFFISESTRLKLKALSMETGYTMTELIIMAYEKYNPDVSDEYNHLK